MHFLHRLYSLDYIILHIRCAPRRLLPAAFTAVERTWTRRQRQRRRRHNHNQCLVWIFNCIEMNRKKNVLLFIYYDMYLCDSGTCVHPLCNNYNNFYTHHIAVIKKKSVVYRYIIIVPPKKKCFFNKINFRILIQHRGAVVNLN